MFNVATIIGRSSINIREAIVGGSIVANVVLAILGIFSIINWIVIFQKITVLNNSRRATKKFRKAFDQATDWMELKDESSKFTASPLFIMFIAGHSEVTYQIRLNPEGKAKIKNSKTVERCLRRAAISEIGRMESYLGVLATIAAVSPFIGLFGTVWGIMDAFKSIGTTGDASLATVAPGISEALVATAIGLVAAIPALIAYNFFQGQLKRWKTELDNFALEFISLSERNFT